MECKLVNECSFIHQELIKGIFKEAWKETKATSGRGSILRKGKCARSRQWWEVVKATKVDIVDRRRRADAWTIHKRRAMSMREDPIV